MGHYGDNLCSIVVHPSSQGPSHLVGKECSYYSKCLFFIKSFSLTLLATHYLQAITVAYSKQRLASETIATTPTRRRNNYLGPKGVDKASMLIKLKESR